MKNLTTSQKELIKIVNTMSGQKDLGPATKPNDSLPAVSRMSNLGATNRTTILDTSSRERSQMGFRSGITGTNTTTNRGIE